MRKTALLVALLGCTAAVQAGQEKPAPAKGANVRSQGAKPHTVTEQIRIAPVANPIDDTIVPGIGPTGPGAKKGGSAPTPTPSPTSHP